MKDDLCVNTTNQKTEIVDELKIWLEMKKIWYRPLNCLPESIIFCWLRSINHICRWSISMIVALIDLYYLSRIIFLSTSIFCMSSFITKLTIKLKGSTLIHCMTSSILGFTWFSLVNFEYVVFFYIAAAIDKFLVDSVVT